MRTKDWMYYAGAGVITLASLPFYWLIFHYARHQPDASAKSVPAKVEFAQRAAVAEGAAPRVLLVPPPPGARCYGEAAVWVKGSAYTQVLGQDGRPARCVGGKILVPVR